MMRTRTLVLGGATLMAIAIAGARQPDLQAATQGAQGGTVQAPMFVVDPMWPKPLPNRWILGSSTGIAIDGRDHIYVLNTGDAFNARTEIGAATSPPTGECCTPAPAVLEFDADGNLVSSWGGPGQGYDWPVSAAGLAVDKDGNVWIGGQGGMDTRILKFSRDGKFIAQYGKPVTFTTPNVGAVADTAYAGVSPGRAGRGGRGGRGGAPAPALPAASNNTEMFGGPMRIAFDATAREAYVADGSRNRRVAVIDMASGAIKRIWGAGGAKPDDAAASGQFNKVACAALSKDGSVYVCDRRNNRLQVFKKDGTLLKETTIAASTKGEGSVWDVAFSNDAAQKYLYVADGMNMKIRVLDRASLGEVTAFGDGGRTPGQFLSVDGIAVDSKGNLYTVEMNEGKRVQKFLYKGIGAVARSQGVVRPK